MADLQTTTRERQRPEDGRGVGGARSAGVSGQQGSGQEAASSGGAASSATLVDSKAAGREGGRIGDWLCTASGVRFFPCDPRPEEIFIRDIAHALSIENRFGGHLPEPYSVASHCVLASSIVAFMGGSLEEQKWALLHDAAEAYVKDIPRPLKRALGETYRQIEKRVQACIAERFGLMSEMPPIVKLADELCLSIERRDLFLVSHAHFWALGGEDKDLPPFSTCFVPWMFAERSFLARFEMLFGSEALHG